MKSMKKNKTPKTNNQKTPLGKMFLAVLLGVLVLGFLCADVFLFINLNQASKTKTSSKTQAEQEASPTPTKETQDDTTSITMEGFSVASATSTPKKNTKATSDNGISNEDYILPESDSKYYTKKDLKKLTKKEVKLARNEIYARHGRKFTKDEEVIKYFNSKDWYEGTKKEVSDSELNKYEIANRDLIVKYEKEKKWN